VNNVEMLHQTGQFGREGAAHFPSQSDPPQIDGGKEGPGLVYRCLVKNVAGRRQQVEKWRVQNSAGTYHVTEDCVRFIDGFQADFVRQVLMTPDCEREVLGHCPSPSLDHCRVRMVVEGGVHFDKGEVFRIGFQRGFVGNSEVGPTASSREDLQCVPTGYFRMLTD
jgi:hypothetical protein